MPAGRRCGSCGAQARAAVLRRGVVIMLTEIEQRDLLVAVADNPTLASVQEKLMAASPLKPPAIDNAVELFPTQRAA